MGKGARVVILNASSHTLEVSTELDDWIAEKDHLTGPVEPGGVINNGYFEYATFHTGHIGIALNIKGSNDKCRLALEEFNIESERTIPTTPSLRMVYAKSELSDVISFSIAIEDLPPPRALM
jgi:hypothetical protein